MTDCEEVGPGHFTKIWSCTKMQPLPRVVVVLLVGARVAFARHAPRLRIPNATTRNVWFDVGTASRSDYEADAEKHGDVRSLTSRPRANLWPS